LVASSYVIADASGLPAASLNTAFTLAGRIDSLKVMVGWVLVGTTPALAAGVSAVAVGPVVSTVTVTGADVVVWPAASRATAVTLYVPVASPAVFHRTA